MQPKTEKNRQIKAVLRISYFKQYLHVYSMNPYAYSSAAMYSVQSLLFFFSARKYYYYQSFEDNFFCGIFLRSYLTYEFYALLLFQLLLLIIPVNFSYVRDGVFTLNYAAVVDQLFPSSSLGEEHYDSVENAFFLLPYRSLSQSMPKIGFSLITRFLGVVLIINVLLVLCLRPEVDNSLIVEVIFRI